MGRYSIEFSSPVETSRNVGLWQEALRRMNYRSSRHGDNGDSKEAPKPIDRKVTIKERPAMVVYVRQFKGFAFSHQEWEEEYENLVNTLSDEETYDTEVWYHIGYNSPFTPAEQRRNEIWIPQV